MVNFQYLNNTLDTIRINPVSRPVGMLDTEIVENAKFIKEHSNNRIIVALSGGIDSEIACLGFMKAGIPFEALTVQYTSGKNGYDAAFAKIFCRKYHIKHHVITVNPENFYTDIKQKYLAQGVHASSIYRYLQIFLLDTIHQMGGTPVFCAGDQQFKVINATIHTKYAPVHILENWLTQRNIIGFPFYYLTTPEIQASYYMDPLIQFLLKDIRYFINEPKLSHSAEKMLVFHKYFIIPRRRKQMGYEQIFELKKQLEKDLVQYEDNTKDFTKLTSEVVAELGLNIQTA